MHDIQYTHIYTYMYILHIHIHTRTYYILHIHIHITYIYTYIYAYYIYIYYIYIYILYILHICIQSPVKHVLFTTSHSPLERGDPRLLFFGAGELRCMRLGTAASASLDGAL
jgi:hypothetical protein